MTIASESPFLSNSAPFSSPPTPFLTIELLLKSLLSTNRINSRSKHTSLTPLSSKSIQLKTKPPIFLLKIHDILSKHLLKNLSYPNNNNTQKHHKILATKKKSFT
jgi:hypothetical protein